MNTAVYGIALLTEGHVEAQLVQAFSPYTSTLRVVRRCADLAEVEAAAQSGIARIAVVGGEDPDLDAHVIETLGEYGMKVVVLSPDLLSALDQQPSSSAPHSIPFMAMGASAVVDAGDIDGIVNAVLAIIQRTYTSTPNKSEQSVDEFSQIIHGTRDTQVTRLTLDTPAPEPLSRGRVIAVWGPPGAPGRSTTAINLAAALGKKNRVLLLDADTANPSVAHMLGQAVDASALAALTRRVARGMLTPSDIHRASIDISHEGFSLLTGLSVPQRWKEVAPTAMNAIISTARSCADYVIVDLASGSLDPVDESRRAAPSRDELTATVIRGCDGLAIVARGDAVGLHRLSVALDWCEELQADVPRYFAVNSVCAASAGPRPINAVAAALSTVIPGESVTVIPRDDGVSSALLAGRSVVSADPKNAAARAFVDFAANIVGTGGTHPQKASQSREKSRNVGH
ncbi:MAG: hypothetical protein CSA82_02810 [Actinobacteria bacterium]|nr:MAG: hypothetical protein CSA82_02810 [Actinomycetota bacterium]